MFIAPTFAMTTHGGVGLMLIHLFSSTVQQTLQWHQMMFNGTIVFECTVSWVHALWGRIFTLSCSFGHRLKKGISSLCHMIKLYVIPYKKPTMLKGPENPALNAGV